MDEKKVRKKIEFYKKGLGSEDYSCYIGFNKAGRKAPLYQNSACYYSIFHSKHNLYRLFLTAGKEAGKNFLKNRNYYEWLLNESIFKDYFITKSVDEGVESAFEINCHVPVDYFKPALIMFRTPLEYGARYPYDDIYNMGFTHQESLALISNITLRHNKIWGAGYGTDWHKAVGASWKFERYDLTYKGESLPQTKKSFYGGGRPLLISSAKQLNVKDGTYKVRLTGLGVTEVETKNVFGVTTKNSGVLELSKENLTEILKQIKGE